MSIANEALAGLLAIAGREPASFASIETGPNALPTRFYAEEAAAAVFAATGVLAADLWRLRGGAAQSVSVSTREASDGLVSFMRQSFDDPSRAPPLRPDDDARGTPAMGFFPTRDGRHVYLHASFPPSARKLHALMGSPEDRDTLTRHTLGRDAMEIEEAIARAGVCGALARTPEEWDASEQGRILASRPVVEVIKIADGDPRPLPADGHAPLSGLRVLDLTRVLAGPTCARTLAQYGADVLYVSSPNLPATEPFVSDTNHGKLSTFLDLTNPDQRAVLKELASTADVFSQGYRAGGLERLGLGPLDLARLNPGIVYVTINAYGHEGAWRTRPGWEQLAQTVTGMAWMHGQHVAQGERGPILQPGAVCDYTTGYLAALGALIALDRRSRFGGSYLVRVSLAQTAVWIRGLGLGGPERITAPTPVTDAERAPWLIHSETGYGGMTHLRPSVRMSATPPRWERPVTPLGAHPPQWPS